MKKIIILMIAGVCLTFSSCKKFLNVSDELASNLTVEQSFANVKYTKRWHADIFNCISEYSRIFDGVSGFSNPWYSLGGEGATNWDNLRTEMTNGYNASNAHFHRFNSIYKSIRQANLFLQKAKPIGISSDKEKLTTEEINRMKSEAKFFIAYSYFSLFELYGPVPIIDGLADPSSASYDFPRASTDEMIQYIDGLYQEVLNENFLPQTLTSTDATGTQVENMNEMVRPTKAVVLALRAKLWVYAASKLFNGGYAESLSLTNKDGKKLFSAYDAAKWETAKKHLETFLTFADANGYTLFHKKNADGTENYSQSVYRVFQDWSKEIIWATSNTYMSEVDGSFDRRCRPTAILDGFSGISVSQQSVDAFFTKNGLDIREDPEHDETGFTDIQNPSAYVKPQIDKHIFNMYVDREPRFYNAITYQNRSWHIQPSDGWTVDFSVNGNNSNNIAYREHYTGYLLYKRNNQEMYPGGSYLRSYARPSILLRMADFYLYYAEACNEVDPSDPNIIKYLDLVRERAGIPGYKKLQETGKKTGVIGNHEKQAYAIRRERQVELFSEGQRYFDIRRWMICGPGEEADQSVYWGMNVDGRGDLPPSDPNSFYHRKLTRRHQWTRAMYLYPIPHDEIIKSPSLAQNPLW